MVQRDCLCAGISLINVHGWCMFIGVSVLLQLGAAFAYYSTIKVKRAASVRPSPATTLTMVRLLLLFIYANIFLLRP